MTNWQAGKYDSLIALHNNVAKNSLWRSVAVNILREIVVPLLLRTRVRHMCQCHRTNAFAAVLVRAFMAVTLVLKVTELKILLAIK